MLRGIGNPHDRDFNRLADDIMAKGLMMCIWALAILALPLPTWELWIDEPLIRWTVVILYWSLAVVAARWAWLLITFPEEKIKNSGQKAPFRTDSKVPR